MNKNVALTIPVLLIFTVVIACSNQKKNKNPLNDDEKSELTKKKGLTLPLNKSLWIGNWERAGRQDGGLLKIKNIKGDSLYFLLTTFDGGNTGEIEGTALIQNKEAIFYSSEDKNCKLTFNIDGDSAITIKDKKSCTSFGGIGVIFSGKFVNTKLSREQKKENLVSLGLLNQNQDITFKALVGTNYQKFVEYTDIIADTTGIKHLDNFEYKVISSGVRGLFTIREYIVMIGKENLIWAAIIDDSNVLYYTNSKDYQDKLPNTIEDWRSSFKQYPLIYKSK